MLGILDPNDHSPVILGRYLAYPIITSVDTAEVHPTYKIWLEPGLHKLRLMCRTEYNGDLLFSGHVIQKISIVDLDIQAGYKYSLELLSPIRSDSDDPQIDIKKKKISD